MRTQPANRALACISRTQHARSPQRVAPGESHSCLPTGTISAEGCCAGTRQIPLPPAFRELHMHHLRQGLLHFRSTLFVPPSAFKREFAKWGNVFSLEHLPCWFPCSHLPTHCMLAYPLHACMLITCMLALTYFHLHTSSDQMRHAPCPKHLVVQASHNLVGFHLKHCSTFSRLCLPGVHKLRS